MSVTPKGQPAPEQFGPFRVLERIGQGGMGVVYRARHESTGQIVAVKSVRLPRQHQIASLRREIRALMRIRHPNIVRIEAEGIAEGLPWYAMELLEGQTLAGYATVLWQEHRVPCSTDGSLYQGTTLLEGSWPSDESSQTLTPRTPTGPDTERDPTTEEVDPDGTRGPLPPVAAGHLGEVLRLLRDLCLPLAYLHSKGIVHRDLKPGNVFLRADCTPVLTDFGVVSQARGSVGREVVEVAGMPIGTVAYAAPEQLLGHFVDARADLYAFGCILYELLVGRRPFLASTISELAYQQLELPPVPPSLRVAGVPSRLEKLVLHLLAKRPRDRMGHADDVAHALSSTLEELGAPRGEEAPDLTPLSTTQTYLYRPEMAGREEVLARLEGGLEQASRGHGACVLLGGESGIGKTFLCTEVTRRAIQQGFAVVTGRGIPISTLDTATVGFKAAPLHLFRPALQTVADWCLEKGPAATAEIFSAGDPRSEARGDTRGDSCSVLAPYEPCLRELPGLKAQPVQPRFSAKEAHGRVLDALAGVLTRFAAVRPLLLVLDDLQWADELSLDALAHLAAMGHEVHPLLIVGTFRQEEAGDALAELLRAPDIVHLDLGRLGERAVGSIVGDMLALAEPPPALVRVLARLSEGNPFFVAEYLRAAVAERLLYREEGRWQVAGGAESETVYEALPLPRQLRQLVARRLSGLSDQTYQVVEVASVLGREVDSEQLAELAGLNEAALLEAAKELLARQVFEEMSGGYRFVHDKLRESTYERIPPERRRELHGRAAYAVERQLADPDCARLAFSTLAHHFTRAEVWSKAIEYLERAGQQALRSFSNREAVAFFTEALAAAPRVAEGVGRLRLARWERALTEAQLGLGDLEAGRKHSERALGHLGQPLPASRVGFALRLLLEVVRRTLPRRWVERHRPRTPAERSMLLETAIVLNRLFENYLFLNQPLPAVYCGLRNINIAERLPPSAALVRGLALMTAAIGMLGPLRRLAARWADRALALAEQLRQVTAQIFALTRVAIFYICWGRWPQVEALLGRAATLARQAGDTRQLEEALSVQALALSFTGRFAESHETWLSVEEASVARGDPQTQRWAALGHALCLTRLGRASEARELLGRQLADFAAHAAPSEHTFAVALLALAHLEAGEVARARELAEEGLRRVTEHPPAIYYLQPAVSALAEVCLALWERHADAPPAVRRAFEAQARMACAVLGQFARKYPFCEPSARLWKGLEAWLSGAESRAYRMWHKGIEVAQRLGMRYEEARIHLEIGRRQGGVDRTSHLQWACTLLASLGAVPDLARARGALTVGETG